MIDSEPNGDVWILRMDKARTCSTGAGWTLSTRRSTRPRQLDGPRRWRPPVNGGAAFLKDQSCTSHLRNAVGRRGPLGF